MWGRKLCFRPHASVHIAVCQHTVLGVRGMQKSQRVSPRRAHSNGLGLVDALLDEVLAGDELAGGAGPQLLHGQAAHHLLVRRGCNLP